MSEPLHTVSVRLPKEVFHRLKQEAAEQTRQPGPQVAHLVKQHFYEIDIDRALQAANRELAAK